jgi:hypothetical protein
MKMVKDMKKLNYTIIAERYHYILKVEWRF